MTIPNHDEPGFLLRMIFDKLTSIDAKLDGHNEKLAAHDVRLANLENDITDLRAQDTADKNTGTSWRQVTLTTAVSTLVALLVALLPTVL